MGSLVDSQWEVHVRLLHRNYTQSGISGTLAKQGRGSGHALNRHLQVVVTVDFA